MFFFSNGNSSVEDQYECVQILERKSPSLGMNVVLTSRNFYFAFSEGRGIRISGLLLTVSDFRSDTVPDMAAEWPAKHAAGFFKQRPETCYNCKTLICRA